MRQCHEPCCVFVTFREGFVYRREYPPAVRLLAKRGASVVRPVYCLRLTLLLFDRKLMR